MGASAEASAGAPASADDAAARRAAVHAAFSQVWRERMQGVGLLHPVLEVEALGFEDRGDGRCLGVLITPWCLNLMLLPRPGEAAAGDRPGGQGTDWPAPGQRRRQRLAAAELVFLGGHEAGLGAYQSCAMFSDMRPFVDQASARAVARELLLAIDRENPGAAPAPASARPDGARPPAAPGAAARAATFPAPPVAARPPGAAPGAGGPVRPSRRRLLFGR